MITPNDAFERMRAVWISLGADERARLSAYIATKGYCDYVAYVLATTKAGKPS
jgi:hypothetical protein